MESKMTEEKDLLSSYPDEELRALVVAGTPPRAIWGSLAHQMALMCERELAHQMALMCERELARRARMQEACEAPTRPVKGGRRR
jgi:hypothetical protein